MNIGTNYQRLVVNPVPFDAKRTNCYVASDNIVIETIPQYLTRIPFEIRDTHIVTIKVPKMGHAGEEGVYPIEDFDTVLNNFDTKLYAFVDGLADADFKEVFSGVDHATLSNLTWGNSAHTGVNSSYAAFNSSGAAINISYAVQPLSGTTVSWDVTNGINAAITLSGNTTITLSNLVAGTSGNLSVINPATLYTLTISGYTNKISPSAYLASNQLKVSGSSKLDVFSWYYDGTYLWWNGGQDYK